MQAEDLDARLVLADRLPDRPGEESTDHVATTKAIMYASASQ